MTFSLLIQTYLFSVPDPDLEISWGGGGGAGLPKKFFRPFRPQFGLKIRGGGPPGPSPVDAPLVLMCALYSCICRLKAVNQARVEPQVKEFWPTFSTRSLIKRVVLERARAEAVLLSEAMQRLSWIE